MTKKILLIIFGIILSLVILETGLRFAAHIAQSHLNKQNFNNNGKLKILCVGDSYTYGLGVERDQAYPAQLESILKQKLGQDNVEVVNAGRPGMNTPILSANFNLLLDNYQPNLVLVLIGTNDEWNFSGFLSDTNPIIDKIKRFMFSLRITRMFEIFTTAFEEKEETTEFDLMDEKRISKMLSLIEKNGGLNNSYYYQAVMMGNKNREENKFKEAKLYYDCALKINPDGKLLTLELSRYYKKALTVLRDELKKDNIKDMLKKIEKTGGLDKGYYFDLIELGNEGRDKGKLEEARLYYDYALKINPDDSLISKEIIQYDNILGEKTREITSAILEKNRKIIRDDINFIYFDKEKFKDDREFSLKMLDLSRVSRALSLFKADLLLLSKSIYLYGFNSEIWQEIDELFIAWYYPEYAIKFYQTLLAKYPDNIDIYLRLVRQYKRVQDYKQMVKYCDMALAISPDNQQAIDDRKMANDFIEQGLSKDYVFLDTKNKLFAQINSVLESGKIKFKSEEILFRDDSHINLVNDSSFQGADHGNNIVKNSEIALGIYVREKRYDTQVEEILAEDENHVKLFGQSNKNQDIFVNQRLVRIHDIVLAKLKHMIVLAEQRKIEIVFLGYPLSVYETVQEVSEAENIEFIDFRQNFSDILSSDNFKQYFLDDGHCTKKGYKIMAKKIAEVLLSQFGN